MNDRLTYSIALLKERLLQMAAFRLGFLVWSILKSAWYQARGNDFEAADATLYFSRILSIGHSNPPLPVPMVIRRRNAAIVRRSVEGSPRNYLHESYVRSDEAETSRRGFAALGTEWARSMKLPRTNDRPDREGDLLVLKPHVNSRERGALLVCYNGSFRRFAALYDLPRLAERYRFVLEPSTWGYEDATLLMFAGLPTDVVVQSQYRPDYDYIRRVGGNMHALDLGAGDWVDPEAFNYNPQIKKRYDVVMLASWLTLKRHDLLFRALRPIRERIGRVALIGYSFAGRTTDDIKREAAREGVLDLLDIHERVPFDKVSEILQESKISVMLSKREGASRAVYESFFANTPVLVSESNVGINRAHINDRTGSFSSDEELSSKLLSMIEDSHRYTPRAWALENTGYFRSSERLNAVLKELATAKGEAWTVDLYRKKNRHNAMYAHDHERAAARRHLEGLGAYLRPVSPTTSNRRGAKELQLGEH